MLSILRSLTSILLLCFATSASADLNYETYRGTGNYPTFPGNGGSLYYSSTLSTGTVSSINHNWGGGYVLDSGRYDDVMVHYSGYITVPSTGSQNIKFYLYADDGVYMKVNDTLVINDWNLQGSYTWNYISTNQTLVGGETYSIDAWMYERGGGAAFKLYWDQGGTISVVPASAYTNTAPIATPTPIYGSSAPTTAQQSRMTAKAALAAGGQGNTVEATITGNDNDINITQAGGPSYTLLSILGNTNAFDIEQNMSGGAVAYNETTIIGANNDVDIIQQGTGNKAAFITITGDSNTANINQKDSGQHFVDLSITGDDHAATILQQGSGDKSATVVLDGSQPWNFDLTQSGASQQTYTLPHAMSDGSSVSGTCAAVGGCNLTIVQQ